MLTEAIDFAAHFAGLSPHGQSERTRTIGGVDLRFIRVLPGVEGRWDRDLTSCETIVVWSGTFDVEFKDSTLHLGTGQCCVVPMGADHRWTSETGAEIILVRQSGGPPTPHPTS